MLQKIEQLARFAYRRWRSDTPRAGAHPEEEAIACFLEDKLSKKESEEIKVHLVSCDRCLEAAALHIRSDKPEIKDLPEELLVRLKDLVDKQEHVSVLEVLLKLGEEALELLSTTGDVLVGQELVPASLLRGRKIKDFKDQVIVLKDFGDIRVEAVIKNKQGKALSLSVTIKEKETQKIIKDLRVTLKKGDLELESYLTDSGKAVFGHVMLGKYTVEISTVKDKVASVVLDIRK
ncbi:hypothetical protein ACFLZ3_01195 [Candidatus Omnitrophota bacterium]